MNSILILNSGITQPNEKNQDKLALHRIVIVSLVVLVTGCVPTAAVFSPSLPTPLRKPIKIEKISATSEMNIAAAEEPPSQIRFKPTPSLPITTATTSSAQLSETDFFPHFAKIAPVSVNVEGLPLPAFINEVFGNLLGLSFEIDNPIQQRTELVTLRATEAQPPQQLYQLAQQVLANYGVAIRLQGDFLRFTASQNQPPNPLPSMIVQGLTLPEVPPSHRPVFQFVPLQVVSYNQVKRWIEQLYKGYDIVIQEYSEHNAIVLMGSPQLVKQAVEAIRFFDQPLMQSRYSLRIEPAFLPAAVLAQKLTEVLTTQGYSVSSRPAFSNITLLPINETNTIMLFAPDRETLAYVQQWAEQLDQLNLNQQTGMGDNKPRLFFYPVKNTPAEQLVALLNNLSGELRKPNPAVAPAKFLSDPNRNAILFTGTGEEWARLLPVLQEMDKPAKQVLIEATIAEITLTDQDQRGIEWVLNQANLGGLEGNLGTLERLGLGAGSSGLTYTLSSAGQVRAILNAFASNSRATILSTPRLMVRSGSEATINVGTEIPTLTSQTSSSNVQVGGDSAILQQIQYRRTGITLGLTPIVYAGRRVDLTINQQISEARPNSTSNISSPEISNRQISTKLSLSDGHSVLLGGLISNSRSEGKSGVPILSDIPLIGQLFRVDKASATKTELIIMIIPYIIDNEEETTAITEALQQQLELITLPTKQSEQKSPNQPK
jgi:general secretion pathway protein D